MRRRDGSEGVEDLPQLINPLIRNADLAGDCNGFTPARRQVSTVWRTESLYLGGITPARVSKAEMVRKSSN